MSTGLKQQWGLKDPKGPPSTAQSDQFKAAYQASANVINQALQYTAVNAEKPKHAAFAAKRDKLACAYQAVLGKINPRNPAVAQSSIDATVGTAKSLADKATEFKNEVEKALQAWQAVEASFETAVNQVEELEAWPDKRAGTLRSVVAKIQEQVNKKMFVEAVKTLESFKSKLQPIYDEYLKQKEAKGKYEAALAALQPKLAQVAECPYKKLETRKNELKTSQTEMETAATNQDYVKALEIITDLTPKVDTFITDKEDLDKKKQAYDDALNALLPRITKNSQTVYVKLDPLHQEMITAQGAMETAANDEEFEEALRLAGELSTRIDAYEAALEELEKQKLAYEETLATLQPRLAEASQSRAHLAYLQPIQADMATAQSEMEAAAQAEEFEQALQLLEGLKAKVDEYFAAIEAKKKEYEAAAQASKPKVDDCLVSANAFASLDADRQAIVQMQTDMEAAVKAEDYEKAKQLATDLGTKADAYLAKAKTEQEKYKKKGDDITKQLDGASEATRADVAKAAAKGLKDDELKHLPIDVRNRLLAEMQKDGLTDDEKEASKLLFSKEYLDPEFEKFDKEARIKMIERMKNDPDFKKARENWHTMTEAERVAILQKTVDYQAEAYGIPKTTIATYSKDSATDYGYYSHSDGKLYINSHDAALKNGGFDEAIDTAVHENGHRQQSTMVDNLSPPPDPPKIKPGDPLYNQAMTFKLNDTDRGYFVYPSSYAVSAANKGPEYVTQPKEHHSRMTGADVQAAGIGK